MLLVHRTPPGAAVSTLHADFLVVFMTKEVEVALLSAIRQPEVSLSRL